MCKQHRKFFHNIYYNNGNKIIIITSQVKIIMILIIIIIIIVIIIKVIICCVKISQEFKENLESNSRNFIIVFLCPLWNYASQVCLSATILWWDKIPSVFFLSLFVPLLRCAFKWIHLWNCFLNQNIVCLHEKQVFNKTVLRLLINISWIWTI